MTPDRLDPTPREEFLDNYASDDKERDALLDRFIEEKAGLIKAYLRDSNLFTDWLAGQADAAWHGGDSDEGCLARKGEGPEADGG